MRSFLGVGVLVMLNKNIAAKTGLANGHIGAKGYDEGSTKEK